MKRGVLIAVVTVAVLIVVGGGIALLVGVGNELAKDDGKFTAEISTTDTIQTTLGEVKADEGKVFVLAVVTITNERSTAGISNNALYLSLNVDNIKYTCDSWDTVCLVHKYAYELKTIGEGSSDTTCYVFEVPKGDAVKSSKVVYDGPWKVLGETTYVGS